MRSKFSSFEAKTMWVVLEFDVAFWNGTIVSWIYWWRYVSEPFAKPWLHAEYGTWHGGRQGWKLLLFEVSSLHCQLHGGQLGGECVLFCTEAWIYVSCVHENDYQPGPYAKTRLFTGGRRPMGKTRRWSWGSPLSEQKHRDPAEEFTRQWESLMSEHNAKNRRVGWRLCKSLWDWVLAQGHVGDGQHQKPARLQRGEAGSWAQG